VAEEGVPARVIAEVIGRQFDVPVVSVPREEAAEHLGWIGPFFARDAPASNMHTRSLLDWEPTHLGLIDDLEKGHHFETPSA
jgi:hypothetical protein